MDHAIELDNVVLDADLETQPVSAHVYETTI